MRRALLAVLAGGTLLAGAACDSDAKTGSDTAAAPSQAASAKPPASPEPDYSANTKQVCDQLQTMYQGELRDFGAAMGKMISYRQAKQATEADKAEDTAASELKAVAVKIRKATGTAQDPQVKAAGVTSAAKLEQSAKDRKYIVKVKTLKDLNGTIEGQLSTWLAPVSGYCGA